MTYAPSRRSVSHLGEFELITLMKHTLSDCHLPPPRGIGDDAAVIRQSSNYEWLVSNDLFIENIHFDASFSSYRQIGYKAAAVNISDIAAMGGNPEYLMAGLAVPQSTSVMSIRALYHGLKAICKEFNLKLIGGDTSVSPTKVFISITIIGKVKCGEALCRAGAKVGDHIYVTGTLGDSVAGLHLLQNPTHTVIGQLPKSIVRFLIKRHLHPTPRVRLGRFLSQRKFATAAIDLSDGLSGDLYHLCQASRVGATIEERRIPISRQCSTYAKQTHESSMKLSLNGGEDYELLFTAPPHQHKQLEQLARRLKQTITYIGIIQNRKHGLQLKKVDGGLQPIPRHSYDHFHQSRP